MSTRLRLAIIAALLAISGTVLAGARQYAPLAINLQFRYADGGLAETHNTDDAFSYAECGSNYGAGFCTVVDTAGTYYGCYTTDPAHIAVIRSMSPDSLFSIEWDESGVCTYVLSYASSRAAPRAP